MQVMQKLPVNYQRRLLHLAHHLLQVVMLL
jgi:hypothetical protein